MSSLPIHLFNITLFNNLAVGVGTNTSQAVNVNDAISYSVQVVISNASSLNGNVYLEASNNGTNFVSIDQTLLPINGTALNHMINVEKPSYSYFRLAVLISAGSCDITAITNGKRQ